QPRRMLELLGAFPQMSREHEGPCEALRLSLILRRAHEFAEALVRNRVAVHIKRVERYRSHRPFAIGRNRVRIFAPRQITLALQPNHLFNRSRRRAHALRRTKPRTLEHRRPLLRRGAAGKNGKRAHATSRIEARVRSASTCRPASLSIFTRCIWSR